MNLFELTFAHVFTGVLILSRVTSFFMTFPIFGAQNLPRQFKLMIGLSVSYIFFFINQKTVFLEIPEEPWRVAIIIIMEIISGICLGFIGRLTWSAINFGVQIFDQAMGLSMAEVFDPSTHTNVSILTNINILLSIVLFFAFNLHHDVLNLIHYTYKVIPPGKFILNEVAIKYVLSLMTNYFIYAFKIAAPVLITVLISNLIMGLITRTAPNLNLFFVFGMFGNIVFGIIVFISTLPFLSELYVAIFRDILNSITHVVKIAG